MRQNRFDVASATVFFVEQLEHIQSNILEIVQAPLSSGILIPIKSDIPVGAEYAGYYMGDATGKADFVANYADDIPIIEVKGDKFLTPIRMLAAAYSYSIRDLQNAQMAQMNIEAEKARRVYEAMQQKLNEIAFTGSAEYTINGWLNNPYIPAAPVSTGGGGSTTWASKTPDEILHDLNRAVIDVIEGSNGAEVPDTIVMPIDQYAYIQTTPRSSLSDTTILQFFLANNPTITLERANELKGAFAGGSNGFIAYKKSIDKFYQVIPLAYEAQEYQRTNLAFTVPVISLTGGVVVPYPMSQRIRYGI